MLSSFLFVRHPFLGPVGSHPPGKRAGSPASLPVCLFPSMPVCRQASIRAGIPTIPPAKENDFRQGCVSLLLRGSIWRCRGSLWRSLATLSTAFPGVWPIETASALCLSTKPLPVCLCAGRHKGWRTGRQVGKDVSPEAGRRADRFACKGKGLSQRLYPLPLRGSIWRCRGSLWRSLPGLIATHLAFGLWPLFGIFTIPMPVCQRAGRQAQGQADWQAGELAGGQECLPPGKEEC
ncbi:hypothetical protein OWT79_09355 [Bacteroides fragilis]|nr:hypothetical protein [Bacteroides fragilis]